MVALPYKPSKSNTIDLERFLYGNENESALVSERLYEARLVAF
jgi:hypothetical protein